MATGLLMMLNLNALTCNETTTGPGADEVTITSELMDVSIPGHPPITIPGTNIVKGPYLMDMTKNLGPNNAAKNSVSNVNFFRNVRYSANGAPPDRITLRMTVVKSGVSIHFDVPLQFTVMGNSVGATIPVGAAIGKLIDLIKGTVIGDLQRPIDQTQAQQPNGQQFNDTLTGAGANYTMSYAFTAGVIQM